MDEPFFSVVVITFNQQKYIKQTLDSIIKQEHGYTYEIIIGDDCSSDGTQDILVKFKEDYFDIIKLILNKNNLGLIGNYFNAINCCLGKYIMICAGDDYWLPGKVKSQIEFMENNPDMGMCCGNFQWLYTSGKKNTTKYLSGLRSVENLIKNYDIAAVTMCVRKKKFLEYIDTVKPREKNWLMEDLPISLWFAFNSKIFYLDEIFAVYRQTDGSIIHPKEYGAIERFQLSVWEVNFFFLNLYKIPYCKKDMEDNLHLSLALNAANYNEFKMYNKYIMKIHLRKMNICLLKYIGNSLVLFKLFYFYRRLRKWLYN